MKISVVTVCYNASSTIGDTLQSVASQDWADVEHLVIDGGSTDTTPDLVSGLLRPGGHFISERDNGIYDAMNKGIALATGDVICLLNADDIYPHSGVLTRVARAFDTHRTDAVLGDVGYVRGDAPDRVIRRYDSSRFSPKKLGWGWMPAHPAMFLTRDCYQRVGKYRTDYRIAADFEFIARAFGKLGLSYTYLPDILVHMRLGGLSTTGLGAVVAINRDILRACRENGIYSNPLMVASKLPLKILEYVRLSKRSD